MFGRTQFAVVGLANTPQGDIPGKSDTDIKADVIGAAIEDAGLKVTDIDGLIYQPGFVDQSAWGRGGDVAKRLGLSPNFVWQIQAGGTSAITSLTMACAAIESGQAGYVAIGFGDCPRSAAKMPAIGSAGSPGGGGADRSTPGAYGMFSPGANHALAARRHMHRYGTKKEHLGAVALAARTYANMRSDAQMHDHPMSMDDYMAAPLICDPLNRLDYCLVSDGGSALIVTSEDRASGTRKPPVFIAGIGSGLALSLAYDGRQYDTVAAEKARRNALAMAGVSIADVDLAQIYDCFTITTLITLEAYGFCGVGEAGDFIAGGALALDGAVPTNTGGGNLSWGYQQGFTPLCEGVRQLRGEGGPTQVPDAEVCLVTGHGGVTGQVGNFDYGESCAILSSRRP